MPSTLFFECSNPDCGFRFPAPPGMAACPRCGSLLRLVPDTSDLATVNPRDEITASHPLEALLDNIRSTYNVGAMFRTSDGAGLTHLHLCGTSPTPENPRVGKTALGAEFSVPWTWHANGLLAAQQIKAQGKKLWALEIGPNSTSIFQAAVTLPDGPLCLVVGNEVSGIDPGILALCDARVWIPMQGYKRSLNVAIAFGIAVYTLRYTPQVHTMW
ncbi:rRNA methylase [Longilinea arvoryzae]|uniref:rRNA methylase n=1 Tax=Longilinea arvoryzae TaxID=360412 RepID=A0A0S7BKU2_9CHLR|nr:RNA methyltransferase [Longilinea arvoryzae]GAP14587.1 rRNA methylase [Longilinea arvoryzae]